MFQYLRSSVLCESIVRISLSVLLFGLAVGYPAWAVVDPARSPAQLVEAFSETAYRVLTARVVLADYELIKKDFPSVASKQEKEIDEWLLTNGAFMSRAQIEQGVAAGVNTKIRVDLKQERTVFRPRHYGRALIYAIGEEGLLDGKGAGAQSPRTGSHKTGLGSLAEMIQEFAVEKLVNQIFKHSRSRFQTIETYAVLDLGFSQIERGELAPAGIVLRQAYKRDESIPSGFQLNDTTALEVEKVLRKYGMTSAGVNYMGCPELRYQNVQGSEDGAIVDFGTYMALKKFKSSLKGMNDWPFRKDLLAVSSPDFVQPETQLGVTPKYWGVESYGQNRIDRLAEWTTFWAERISKDKTSKSRTELTDFVKKILKRETQRWANYDARSGQAKDLEMQAPPRKKSRR